MRLAIIHLSDIHFRTPKDPIVARVDKIISAATSEDPSVETYLVMVSGDIANSGDPDEYLVGVRFFKELGRKLRERKSGSVVRYFGVPGNHDCHLPEADATLRNALISGVLPTLHEAKPDAAVLSQLLEAQSAYGVFCQQVFTCSNWNGICSKELLQVDGKGIQVALYNTAILSRRNEVQGQLDLPIKVIRDEIALNNNAALSISVFHHSYPWLDSNVLTAFRAHIERTSDIALMGHQHFQQSYRKLNSSGENILYFEGGALQDEGYPQRSEFQVLLVDLDGPSIKSLHFRWSSDIYRRVDPTDWSNLKLNRGIRANYRVTDDFEHELNRVGTPLIHRLKGELGLRDIFVYPDFIVRTQAPKPSFREVRGENLRQYIRETERVVFQFPSLGGKSSLAKIIFSDCLNELDLVPILIDGKSVRTASENRVVDLFWKRFQDQFGEGMLENFRQHDRQERIMIVDDWHEAKLNTEGRRSFLQVASQYFGKIILFTDELFQIQELVNKSPDTLLSFDYATPREFGHASRGRLIDRWLTLGREHVIDSQQLAREIEETENLIRSLIGRNTLPSLPFVILCILQADQEDKTEAPEAGSFGYLYEVLITTALNTSTGRRTQLEKKYMYLSRLAYEMFRENIDIISAKRAREIAEEYAQALLVRVDIDPLLADLETARVLNRIGGNYTFAYPHLFYYFVARYYKDNLVGGQKEKLLQEIHQMANMISSDQNSTILMFFLYLTRDPVGLIEQITLNADRIYSNVNPATLEEDVSFLNQIRNESETNIPDEGIDLDKNRKERREARDRIEKEAEGMISSGNRCFTYSDDLTDSDKFHLAFKHVDLLGQVIRNFPGSLPGPEKLAILRSTYLLGLRLLRSLLRLFELSYQDYADIVKQTTGDSQGQAIDLISELVDRLILLLNRIIVLGVLIKISSSVGLPDLESAYEEVLTTIENTSAVQLIDLCIKLDHSTVFPEDEIRRLHANFVKNQFADTVLKDLVLRHIQKFDVPRPLRQRLSKLFNAKANSPLLIDPGLKK